MINNLENANSQTQHEEQQSQPNEDLENKQPNQTNEDLENKQPNLNANAASPTSNNDIPPKNQESGSDSSSNVKTPKLKSININYNTPSLIINIKNNKEDEKKVIDLRHVKYGADPEELCNTIMQNESYLNSKYKPLILDAIKKFTKKLKLQKPKHEYRQESIDISPSISYAISPDGALFATIDKSNNFSIYFLIDIIYGRLHRIDIANANKSVSALAFVQISDSSFNINQLEKYGSNILKFSQSSSNCINWQLAIAPTNENIIQVFNISNRTFSNEIEIKNPAISMKVDKFNPSQIFYIEEGTRNLMRYNFITHRNDLISNSVNFYEELVDGSLIISSQTGIKYFDKQLNLIFIRQNFLKPIAYFSLSYQKVLMIGATKSYHPSFTVFDPLSKKIEPVYKLPYFEYDEQKESPIEKYTFCSDNGHKSFYIGSLVSNSVDNNFYVVHCISDGDFYSIEKVLNVRFPVLAMHYLNVYNGILAIFGETKITMLKFENNDVKIHLKETIIEEEEEEIDPPQDDDLKETFAMIREMKENLPKNATNPIRAVSFLKNEADQILKTADNLNKNIESLFKKQIIAFNLSSQLSKKKQWNSSDAKYYLDKIEKEKESIHHNLQNANRQYNLDKSNFDHRFSFSFENTVAEKNKGNQPK